MADRQEGAVLRIEAGVCGFNTTVRASSMADGSVGIRIEGACEKVSALSERLTRLSLKELFHRPFNQNPVYEAAGLCELHAACPVPCGVLKAAEAALGMALKRDVGILFE